MELEYKASPAFTKAIDGRTVEGIFAVHGNVDEGGDRGHPGLFGDGTAGGRMRARFLWQHDASAPPIARIDRVYEVASVDLPPAVRLYAPDATGGVAVTRTYLDTPRASEVLAGLTAGAITEMSYAYQPKQWAFTEGDDGRVVRDLYRADLLDISDVLWGMNPATSADGQKRSPMFVHHETVLAAVKDYTTRYQEIAALRAKEGRILSGESRKRIEGAIEALAEAESALRDLLTAAEPLKTAPPEPEKAGRADVRAAFVEWQRRRAAVLALGANQ